MKVQLNRQQTNQQKYQRPQFKGCIDTGLRYFATNQAIGANAVDLGFMVAPRTGSDMVGRGPAAGFETLRREIMGTVNDSCIGLFGAAAGWIIAHSINKKFGLNANHIFTAPETLNILAENKAEQIKNNKTQLDYIRKTLTEVKAYNPTSLRADSEGFVRIGEDTIDEVSKIIDKSLKAELDFHKWTESSTVNSRAALINKIIENTGAETQYVLESSNKNKVSKTTLKSLLNDLYIVSDSFNRKKVNEAFKDQIKAGNRVEENRFIKDISKFMKTRAGLGFAFASALGLSVQPINMYITKLKTGTDGFVGVEGRSKDNSTEFKALKAAGSVGFFSMILATLNLSPIAFLKSPYKFMEKMSFTGKMPTINQLKGVYGITIISRICSARDKDELREVLTKDTLGYLSWLVLGDIINKLTADTFDKSVLNYKKGKGPKDKNVFKRTFFASLKTRDEILIETLAKHNVSSVKKQGEGIVNKTFSEMLKDLDKIDAATKKVTKKRLRVLNGAQIAGYLFSGLVLGLGIPNLNIYVTNMLDKKRKAAAQKTNS